MLVFFSEKTFRFSAHKKHFSKNQYWESRGIRKMLTHMLVEPNSEPKAIIWEILYNASTRSFRGTIFFWIIVPSCASFGFLCSLFASVSLSHGIAFTNVLRISAWDTICAFWECYVQRWSLKGSSYSVFISNITYTCVSSSIYLFKFGKVFLPFWFIVVCSHLGVFVRQSSLSSQRAYYCSSLFFIQNMT